MTTKVPAELSSTPSIVDNGDATVISIDSGEVTTFSGEILGSKRVTLTNTSSQHLRLAYNNSFYWDITRESSNGDLTFTSSNVSGVSTTLGAANKKLTTAGGILFGTDTADANTLDDYEEGDWTPLFVGTTGTAGLHAQNYNAKYTKVGRLVSFYVTIVLTNKGDYTGLTRLQGLPFPNAGSTTQVALGSFPDTGYGTSSGNTVIAAAVEASQSYISFYEGSRLDVRHSFSDVGTGYYCNVGGTYMTSS